MTGSSILSHIMYIAYLATIKLCFYDWKLKLINVNVGPYELIGNREKSNVPWKKHGPQGPQHGWTHILIGSEYFRIVRNYIIALIAVAYKQANQESFGLLKFLISPSIIDSMNN